MIKIVSINAMREIESAANEAGFTYDLMMENAGAAAARRAAQLLESFRLPDPAEAKVTILVGPGKNGGDGLVAARVLAELSSAQVRVYLLKKRPEDDPLLAAVRSAGLFIADAEDDQRFRVLSHTIASANLLIDALFGIGVQLPLRDEAVKMLRAARAAINGSERGEENLEGVILHPTDPRTVERTTRPYVLAIDCPSGLDCDTGAIDSHTLTADETITFIAVKPGLLTYPGAAHVGKLTMATIGVPENTKIPALKDEKLFFVDGAYARDLLPERSTSSHKGSYGKALIIGGSINYSGAPAMSALAAYRSGTGLVTVGTPAAVAASLGAKLVEPTWLIFPSEMGVLADSAAPLIRKEAEAYTAMLIGPGINREKTTRDLLIALFAGRAKTARQAIGFLAPRAAADDQSAEKPLPPLSLDADALNLLSEIDQWWTHLPPETIITPHAGEFARLAGMEREAVEANRFALAAEKAAAWNCIVLLKGAHTVIAHPDGRTAVLPFKTSALSTAGTGDVLSGLIVGFLAQGAKPFDAAVLAGYMHGMAGLEAARIRGGERAVIAGDVLEAIPAVLAILE